MILAYVVLIICYVAPFSMGGWARLSSHSLSTMSDDTTDLDWDSSEHWVLNTRSSCDLKSKTHSQEWLCYLRAMRARIDKWMDYC
jgi:hypothetical protein